MTRYRHHGHKIVGIAEPPRRAATRDSSAQPVNSYSEAGGPRPQALPSPPEIAMPSPTTTQHWPEFGFDTPARDIPPPADYVFPEPPQGMTAAEVARANEKYWVQSNGLPEVERNRRAGVVYQRYLDNWWAKKPAFVNFGAKAKDEGSLWRTLCELGQPDGAGDLAGTGEDGRNYRLLRTDGGFTLEQEEIEDVPLQTIGDRRAVSGRDREVAALKEIQRKNDALWAKPFK